MSRAALGRAGRPVWAAALFGWTALVAGCGGAAGAPSLTLEDIHRRGGGASRVVASADGRIAVVAEGPAGRGIYLMAAATGPSAAGLETPQWWRAGSAPAWSPDGDRIAYVADGDLWVAAAESGAEAVRLTEGLAGVRAPAFSPDGRQVAFYATASGSQDIWLAAADGRGTPRPLTRAAMALDDPRFVPAWSPDGTRIAYVSNAADYWFDDVWVVEVATGETRRLTTSLMAASTPVWSPDGERIALFGTAKDEYWYQDLAYIYIVDPARPGSERVLDMQIHASDHAMRHRPHWSTDGSALYFPYVSRGEYEIWSVAAAGGVATRVTNLGGAIRSFDMVPGGPLVFVRSGPTQGAEVYAVRAEGGPAERLTRFAPEWPGLQVPREVSYRSFDGLYIQGYLYLPPQAREGAACPALVQVHGGGTNSYLNGLNLTEQYLASKGFVVLAINYRGGSGFGRAFQDLSVEDWLGDQALDAGAAADYLRGLSFVSGKVGIYGGSYGGSMTMAAITRTPEKFDAAVAMRGAYSKTATFAETDRLGKIFTKTGHGGLPDERPDSYETSNTLERLDRIRTPVLLLHGEKDRRVPFTHFELAVAELERLGKEFESHSYPEEGHGFREPENRIDMYGRLESFFTEHLGGCGAP